MIDCPADVVDRLLWQDAQHMKNRHASRHGDWTCQWCGREWPCPVRRLAERADTASRQPWRESWTMRNDMNGLRMLPGLRADHRKAGARRNHNRRGY